MNRFATELGNRENLVLLPGHSRFSAEMIRQSLGENKIDSAVVFQSSGTTDQARLVCHSKAGLLASARAVNTHLQAIERDVWLCALPVIHVGGFGVFVRAFCSSSRVYECQDGWDPMRFHAQCKELSATLSSLVPTQVFDLVEQEIECPATLRAVLVGGGHLDGELEASARGLGWPIMRTYGLSEAGSQVATQAGDQLRLLPHLEAELDVQGRLKLRGGAIAIGYLSQGADGTWKIEPIVDEDGWFQTDDLVELEGGNLRFLGRNSSRVKVLGELVDVDALERAFLPGLGSALAAAVIDVPDERSGNALIVVHSADLASAEVVAALDVFNASVIGFERISRTMQIERIPRSDLGKVRRGELRQMVIEAEK